MQSILIIGLAPDGTIGPVQIREELNLLKSEFNILYSEEGNKLEFMQELLPNGKYVSISAIYRLNSSKDSIGVFDQQLIQAFPPSLKFIAHLGAGYDQIDIAACTQAGIQVSNTPGHVDDSTATTAMFLIISALRGFWHGELVAHQGNFKQGVPMQNDPEHKVLGIIGFGGIGRALAKRALAFDMKIQYHNRKPVNANLLEQFPPNSIKYLDSLDTLLATSDVVFLSIPFNPSTANFFDEAKFNACKNGACFINTARGGVVDEAALIAALRSGKLKSAGLDVYPNEPIINPELLAMHQVVTLPHMGTETIETQRKMELAVLNNITNALRHGSLLTIVPEQAGLTFHR